MKSNSPSTRVHGICALAAACLAALLLFPGLGKFGLWEPQETARANVAGAYADGRTPADVQGSGGNLAERLAALSWKSSGTRSELAARLPTAALALAAVLALYLLLAPLAGQKPALYAALAFASSPILLFHGRQLTGGMPLLLAEVLSVGGLALAAFGPSPRLALWGAAAALPGLVIGFLSSGALMGVAFPSAAVFLAALLGSEGGAEARPQDDPMRKHRTWVVVVCGVLAAAATAAYFAIAAFGKEDLPFLTGGLTAGAAKHKSFEFAFEQIVYGWFPWSALLPVVVIGLFGDRSAEAPGTRRLQSLVIAGITVGYVAQTAFMAYHGTAPCFIAFPVAVGVALALSEMENRSQPGLVAAFAVLVVIGILVSDFNEDPSAILSGYGFDRIALPKQGFAPAPAAAIASAPIILIAVVLALLGKPAENPPRWVAWRLPVLVFASAGLFGGYLTQMLVPDLSLHLSSKHAVESYARFKGGGEPLGVLGSNRLASDATELDQRQAIDWLSRRDRVFVLLPPRSLADINSLFRARNGRHVFVLDAESDRFLLATSQPKAIEKNQNPIAAYVSNREFAPPPPNPLSVNFDDKITLLGWQLQSQDGSGDMVPGQTAYLTTFWRCDAKIPADYQVFMHIDGPGGRINGDHWPVKGVYPTSYWQPGDYIRDALALPVPLYQQSGAYSIKLGLYRGNERLRVLNDPKAENDSVWIARIRMR